MKKCKGITTTKYFCKECGTPITHVSGYYGKGYCKSCCKKGKLHYNWKGGKRIRFDKYILIWCPNHPNKIVDGYVLEHRLVMEANLNNVTKKQWLNYCIDGAFPKNSKFLTLKEIIHHIDGNPSNNNIKNLMLFPNNASHHKFVHYNEKSFICKFCGKNQKDGNK